jgi:hypothetical protein
MNYTLGVNGGECGLVVIVEEGEDGEGEEGEEEGA